MLTVEQKNNNEIKFMELLSKLNIDLTELNKFLDEIDYFNKPASTQYFNAFTGGLCKYALDLYFELAQLVNAYFPGRYTEEDVIKIALLKDLYRAELYESYLKNVKNDATGQWEVQPAFKYKEDRPTYGDINFGSYMIAKRYVTFTDEQIEAIIYSRLIDRPIRPLFPKGFYNDVAVVCTALSVDPDIAPEPLAMLGSSIALSISDIPCCFINLKSICENLGSKSSSSKIPSYDI